MQSLITQLQNKGYELYIVELILIYLLVFIIAVGNNYVHQELFESAVR